MDLLASLLSAPRPAPVSTLAELRAHVLAHSNDDDTIARAAVAGLAANGIGFAFAGGYQAALARLVPHLSKQELACLCATEASGGGACVTCLASISVTDAASNRNLPVNR